MVLVLTLSGLVASIRQRLGFSSTRCKLSPRLDCSTVVTRADWAAVAAVDQQQFGNDDCCTVDEYLEWEETGLHALFLYCEEQADPIGVIEWELDQGLYLASILVLPAFQRKGYATEAIRALMQHFSHLRAWCQILDDNMASLRVFEKLQFKSTDRVLARGYRVHVQ